MCYIPSEPVVILLRNITLAYNMMTAECPRQRGGGIWPFKSDNLDTRRKSHTLLHCLLSSA